MLRLMATCLFCVLPLCAIEHIKGYEIFVKQYEHNQTHFITTRRFELQGVTFYLTINTRTLQTSVLTLDPSVLKPLDESFYATPFATTLHAATTLHVKGGATHASLKRPNATYLTMDLCPSSKKGFEREFLEHLSAKNGKTPIAIAITSAWIDQHEEAFEALLHNPLLEITWVNHSHTHFYDRHLRDDENFMRHPSTHVKHEILGLEKKLLEEGITPSVFFRFPGLIADEKLMKELRETYFLIPLGANAWIAKNEPVREGSFILIHGNKNEPQGIEMLEQMLPELLKTYRFHPIHEAFLP